MPRLPHGLSGIGGFGAYDVYAKPGDAAKFDEKVTAYLEECRNKLLSNVIEQIIDAGENAVTLSVVNDTDDPIVSVEVTARIPRAGILVYTAAPPAVSIPALPKWPSPMDDVLSYARSGASVVAVTAALPYNLSSTRIAVTNDEDDEVDYYEIRWKVGTLLARTEEKCVVSVLAGPRAPSILEVDLSARSTSHRGVATAFSALEISDSEPWHLADWWDPTPSNS